ncbi:MAG: hypothetical protein LBL61_00230 [Elusimicrobiota bacterium]|jgi:hypothetical protein|nr:hypothetical protein [Elusimicrobiota bacterium]
MTDKELEKLFLDFADGQEASAAKIKIKNVLAARPTAKPVLKLLLPAAAAAAAFALLIFFYAQGSSGARKDAWEPQMQNVSVYDSPMYVYLINARYEENRL